MQEHKNQAVHNSQKSENDDGLVEDTSIAEEKERWAMLDPAYHMPRTKAHVRPETTAVYLGVGRGSEADASDNTVEGTRKNDGDSQGGDSFDDGSEFWTTE